MSVFLEQLFQVLTFAGIGQGFFVVLLLNSKSIRKSRANLFLSVLLIALSFSIAHILFAGVVINHLSAQVFSIGDPTFYLVAPLLWFYANELTGHRVIITWNLFLHFLPFFLIIIFSLSFGSINFTDLNLLLDNHRLTTILFWLTVVLQFTWYQILIHRRWIAYQKFITQEVSNTENVSISWVRFFMVVFLIINLLFFFSLFAAIHLENGAWLPKATALIFSLSVFALGYKGILQREIFQKGEAIKPDHTSLPPPSTSFVSKQDQELINRLLYYVAEMKPYLDPELTLSQLAKDLNISRSQLSQLINDGIGDNFYDFINKYRVEQVKHLMIAPEVKHLNMLGIALEAGFKSKSTFNLIFKRFTGLTPTEYRKNLSQ